MKMNPLMWLLIGAVVLGGAYYYFMRPGMAPVDQAPVVVDNATMTIVLSEQNDLGQSGTATIKENSEGKAVVSLKMSGGSFPAPQPAHIHLGSCPSPGAVEYPLTNVVNGTSETTLDLSLAELKSRTEAMAVNVHKSASEASVYTACGNLPASAGAAETDSTGGTRMNY